MMKAVFAVALIALAACSPAQAAFADPVEAGLATPELSTLVSVDGGLAGWQGPKGRGCNGEPPPRWGSTQGGVVCAQSACSVWSGLPAVHFG